MSLTLFIDDTCPRCRKSVKVAEVDLHPSRPGLAVYNYHCIDCGPVRAKVVSLTPKKLAPDLAA
jgi:hypothetical protein